MRFPIALAVALFAAPAFAADALPVQPDPAGMANYYRARLQQANDDAAQSVGVIVALQHRIAELEAAVAKTATKPVDAPKP